MLRQVDDCDLRGAKAEDGHDNTKDSCKNDGQIDVKSGHEEIGCINSRFNLFFLCFILCCNFKKMVSWSSRLWHLLNTQNVPSSILGEIILFFDLISFFAKIAIYLYNFCWSVSAKS